MQFSFLLINDVQDENNEAESIIKFRLFYASNNTRLKGFEKPIVIDNKRDIDNAIDTISKTNLIEYFTMKQENSKWKFYKILSVSFHVYIMNTPIGKVNELPDHLKQTQTTKN